MTSPLRLADLDELILTCRTENASSYIAEAVSCIKIGAYRSAIIATWVAVVYDYVDKLRELSLSGDRNAAKELQTYESAHAAHDLEASLKFERELLSSAKNNFELISTIEHENLSRLQQDRHKCAHPSYAEENQPYIPSPELARYHLRNAIEHLLSREPVQGKSATKSIFNDLDSPYFPDQLEDIVSRIKRGPLTKAREVLVTNVVQGLLKALIVEEEEPKEKQFLMLKAIIQIRPASSEKALTRDLPKLASKVLPERWNRVVSLLGRVPSLWHLLTEDQRNDTVRYVQVEPLDEGKFIFKHAIHVPELEGHVISRIPQLSVAQLEKLIRHQPRSEYISEVISRLRTASSFNSSRELKAALRNSIPHLNPEQVSELCTSYVSNEQFNKAYGMGDLMQEVIDSTPLDLDLIKSGWESVLLYLRSESRLESLQSTIEGKYPELELQDPEEDAEETLGSNQIPS